MRRKGVVFWTIKSPQSWHNYYFKGIHWDTDGEPIENLNLPKNFVMEVDDKTGIDPKDFDIANILSDEYGFCVDGIDEVKWWEEDDDEIDTQ